MDFRSVIAGAAGLAVMASAAQAGSAGAPVMPVPPAVSAYAELFVGGVWEDLSAVSRFYFLGDLEDEASPSLSSKGWVLGGAARANYWIAPLASMQFDLQGERTEHKIEGTSFVTSSMLGGGHINLRDPQRGLVGAFAAVGRVGGGDHSFRHAVAGGELQWYFNNFTLYLQGGFYRSIGHVDDAVDRTEAWFVRGTGRYFVTPYLMLEGTVLYAEGKVVPSSWVFLEEPIFSDTFNLWLWQAKAEWRLPQQQLALFAKYQGLRAAGDFAIGDPAGALFVSESKTVDHRVMAGLRIYFGQDTLRGNDRTGATLDIISPLAALSQIIRVIGEPTAVD